ncbi:MAG: helix-turn-helix domain-containing protein [Bdellovibrionales bacterium]|nr:helix-turn-helix domain-containing protein [Bdellovibrionales bacterium]
MPSLLEKGITELLTVGDLANILKCSKGTIRNWVSQGYIPVVRPAPRMVRFSPAQINAWLLEKRTTFN